ncbi:Inner membrane protein yhjD [Leclercia adecarboxylata]|uniref:Inner membrane protein yhjD n=1 Tax=Leclercia adecarboxylata TaxID=83655 RepID=A0A4V6YYD1_9ENTR|nr:Inner membrane protein yhjD [Leclercia adecarboxylata]
MIWTSSRLKNWKPVRPKPPAEPKITSIRKTGSLLDKAKDAFQLIQQQPMIAHLLRATERFNDRLGNQFGAAITYFSFLSMIPILMLSFAQRASFWSPTRRCCRISSIKFCRTSAIRRWPPP